MLSMKDLKVGDAVQYRQHPDFSFVVRKIKGFSVVIACPHCGKEVTSTPYFLTKGESNE